MNRKKYFCCFLLVLIAGAAHAQGILGDSDIISATNTSSHLLRKVFGSSLVEGSFDSMTSDSTANLMALLFRILNISVMIFAAFFSGITIVQGAIQTAGSGVFMGKKHGQSAYFTWFRTMAGLGMVFPQYSGYSTIQVLVMTIILKGGVVASNLSHLMLTEMMTFDMSILFTQPNAAADFNPNDITNKNVQWFYNEVVEGAVCAVSENRKKDDDAEDRASKLYTIKDSKITFANDCGEIILNYPTDINPAEYFKTITTYNASLEVVVSPIVQNIFNFLPRGEDACNISLAEANKFNRAVESCFTRVAKGIINLHKSLSGAQGSIFALKYIKASAISNSPGMKDSKNFLYDWFYFPTYFLAILKIKAEGQDIDSSKDLINRAYKVTSNTIGEEDSNTGTINLGGTDSRLGCANPYNSSYVNVDSDYAEGYSIVEAMLLAQVTVQNKTDDYFDKNIGKAKQMIRDHVGYLTQSKSYPNDTGSMMDLWNSSPPKYKIDSAWKSELQSIKKPINTLVHDVTEEWLGLYVPEPLTQGVKKGDASAQIAISPLEKLSEASSKIAGTTIMFMLTLTRNVVVEQMTLAWDSWWQYTITKYAAKAVLSGVSLAQEMYYDEIYCLLYPPQQPFTPGTGLRPVVCNNMIFPTFPIPVPNPAWIVQFSAATVGLAVSTAAHVAQAGIDTYLTEYFRFRWMLISEQRFQYYPIIVVAATPMMIVSNLLAVWVPLLPSIVYFVSVIGWLFVVFEAMAASPMILLGMTFPQGHDFLGSAQQTLILLLSVFVRAPLIVIGFFFSMLMLSLSMVFLAYGIVPLVISTFGDQPPGIASGFMVLIFMVMVMYLTATLMTQSLSFCYKLPNIIVRWIGAQASDGMEEAAISQLKQAVDSQNSSVMSSLQQAGLQAKGSSQGMAQKVDI